jgi:hypothetical protein
MPGSCWSGTEQHNGSLMHSYIGDKATMSYVQAATSGRWSKRSSNMILPVRSKPPHGYQNNNQCFFLGLYLLGRSAQQQVLPFLKRWLYIAKFHINVFQTCHKQVTLSICVSDLEHRTVSYSELQTRNSAKSLKT